jgi:hypothetical protein
MNDYEPLFSFCCGFIIFFYKKKMYGKEIEKKNQAKK